MVFVRSLTGLQCCYILVVQRSTLPNLRMHGGIRQSGAHKLSRGIAFPIAIATRPTRCGVSLGTCGETSFCFCGNSFYFNGMSFYFYGFSFHLLGISFYLDGISCYRGISFRAGCSAAVQIRRWQSSASAVVYGVVGPTVGWLPPNAAGPYRGLGRISCSLPDLTTRAIWLKVRGSISARNGRAVLLMATTCPKSRQTAGRSGSRTFCAHHNLEDVVISAIRGSELPSAAWKTRQNCYMGQFSPSGAPKSRPLGIFRSRWEAHMLHAQHLIARQLASTCLPTQA